jgi:hypothetical protein
MRSTVHCSEARRRLLGGQCMIGLRVFLCFIFLFSSISTFSILFARFLQWTDVFISIPLSRISTKPNPRRRTNHTLNTLLLLPINVGVQTEGGGDACVGIETGNA